MAKSNKIDVKGTEINIFSFNEKDYISLTDITKGFNEGSGLIGKWITNKNTIEYIGVWEKINNPNFNYPEFGVINQDAGVNRFIMSVGQWIERTNAIGMIVKLGKYGGSYAHKDIAFHFAMWLSPEFQIYLINEFQRLKEVENKKEKLEWNFQRYLSKVNYTIHTDAIKENLIPQLLDKNKINLVYATEADVLNVALLAKLPKIGGEENPSNKGNIRDYATIEQLVVLSNLESLNSVFISQNISQPERLVKLNEIAISQMKALAINTSFKKLKE